MVTVSHQMPLWAVIISAAVAEYQNHYFNVIDDSSMASIGISGHSMIDYFINGRWRALNTISHMMGRFHFAAIASFSIKHVIY